MTPAALIAFLAVFPPETEVSIQAGYEGASRLVVAHDGAWYDIDGGWDHGEPSGNVAVWKPHTYPNQHFVAEVPLADFPAWYAAHAPTEEP